MCLMFCETNTSPPTSRSPLALIAPDAVILPVMLKLSLNEIDSFAVPAALKLEAKTVPEALISPEAVMLLKITTQ